MSGINKMKVTTEVRTILLDVPAIREIIGDKIFPVIAPPDTKGDFILYQRDKHKQEYSKMGVARSIPTVFINVVSDDYDRSIELASLVYDALEGDFVDPVMSIHLDDSSEDFEGGKYIQILAFRIE